MNSAQRRARLQSQGRRNKVKVFDARWALLMLGIGVLAGCGAAAAPKTPSEQPGFPMGEPTSAVGQTADDPQAQLDQAERELQSALGQPGYAQPPGVKPAQPTSPAPAPTEAFSGTDSTMQASQNPCVTACRALASMGRAAEHLCGLSGESDARCEDARTRVSNATSRVRAQCSAC